MKVAVSPECLHMPNTVIDARRPPLTTNERLPGRLTQLIALAGPSGSWRKTIIDKAIV